MTPRFRTRSSGPPRPIATDDYGYLWPGNVPGNMGGQHAAPQGVSTRDPRMVSSGFMQRVRKGMADFTQEQQRIVAAGVRDEIPW